jgi:hypothetical protein
MKRFILLISSLMMVLLCSGQSDSESILRGTVKKSPMKNGEIYKLVQSSSGNHVSLVTIVSNTDSVFSSCNGKINSIISAGNVFTISVVDVAGNFYYYSGLQKVFVKKDDGISKNLVIGLANELSKGFYNIMLLMKDKNGKQINEDDIWKLINVQ